jgi:hypothetical protein
MSDATTPNVSNDAIAEFQVAYERVSASIARDSGIRRALIKTARDNGVDTDMAVLAVKTKKKYSVQEAAIHLRNLLRSLSLVHMPLAQGDLFDFPKGMSGNVERAREHWDAENQGYLAGQGGGDPDACPFAPGSDQHAIWTRAYQRGGEDHAAQTDTQQVPAARTRRSRRHENGEAAPSRRRRDNAALHEVPAAAE